MKHVLNFAALSGCKQQFIECMTFTSATKDYKIKCARKWRRVLLIHQRRSTQT